MRTAGARPPAAALVTAPLVTVALAATTGCSALLPGSAPTADGVTVLAKAAGWSPSIATDERFAGYFSVLEIAYDETTARAAWEAAVPAGLPERSGEPRGAGRYASLADVDLDQQVLVVFSGGQSGACPGWLGDVSVQDGQVLLGSREHVPGNGCTDDYVPYRLLLAVDRDKVPAEDDVPLDDVLVDDRDLTGLVTAYPAG